MATLDWRSTLPPGFRWPDGIRAAACFTFDLDAESAILVDRPETAGWLDVMSHQAYGPRTGLPRLLRLLDRQGIRATFFVPGYSAERWPEAVRAIRDAGHEIGHHGYLHEGSRHATPAQEEARLLRGLDALDRVADVRPVGYRAPTWELTYAMPAILARHGFRYDSGLMDADHPYHLATTPHPDAPWIVELPAHWSLDDWEAYVYLPEISGSGAIARPSEVLERWTLELDALVREGGLFVLTNHPFVSGRASRAEALGRLMEHARATDGLWIGTCTEIADWVAGLDLEPVVQRPPVVPEADDRGER
ncbi:MAG: polysaccharide deacetylase family protein [Candidatus Limnocylindrales bacterium]